MKPLFTVHAGEWFVGNEIERRFPRLNMWVPAKDTGIDLLLTNADNSRSLSLQVKESRDYAATHHPELNLRASGWWTLKLRKIETSKAQLWVLVLIGFGNRTSDFIIIEPKPLATRLAAIHGRQKESWQSYLTVDRHGQCFDMRGLEQAEKEQIVAGTYRNEERDFTAWLNNWAAIEALNDDRPEPGEKEGEAGEPNDPYSSTDHPPAA
jgi:hypothetical protein